MEKNRIKRFNENSELNISDVIQSLLLLKGRIQSLEHDMKKIDSATAQGRLKTMYNQVERILDKLNNNVV